MIGEFQPKFDYRPHFVKDENGIWQPDIDEATGLQVVNRIALPTLHQLPWPSDKTVSAISDTSWFTITKGWGEDLNPVHGDFWFIGGYQPAPQDYIQSGHFDLGQDWQWSVQVPAGTRKISVALDAHDHAVGWSLEVKARTDI